MRYWNNLVDEILSVGTDLGPNGISNWGFERKKCLEAISMLENHSIPILGGDVYNLRGQCIVPAHDNWLCDRLQHESYSSFSKRSSDVAYKYVSSYPEKIGWHILFSVVPDVDQ